MVMSFSVAHVCVKFVCLLIQTYIVNTLKILIDYCTDVNDKQVVITLPWVFRVNLIATKTF